MRIVFVQAGIGAGGAEKIVNLLAHHRADLGNEVHVLAFGSRPGGSYFPYHESVSVETLDGTGAADRRGILRILRRVWWLRRRLAALRPDLIVSFLTKTNVLVMVASRGLRTPVVISERNHPDTQEAHPLWKPMSIFVARAAASVVMQTEASRRILPPRLQARSDIIPNPCVLPKDVRATDGDGNRIIAVGRLVHQKGFDLLIEAFARLAPDAPQATLTIFGEGPEREALEAQVQGLGLGNRVQLPGVTDSPGEWLAAGDIFVMSSRSEGFPNVLVEALTGGLATVAFDAPWGASAILTDQKFGILVPPEDVEALAVAIRRLIGDPELRSALRKATSEALERFALPRVLAQWDTVFEQAAGGASS